MSLNKVMLIGNVGADPEIRYLAGASPQENIKVASLRLATSERYRDRNTNEVREQTEWHSISAWRGLADIIEKYVRKGTQIYVEGRLRTRTWTDRDNNTRYSTEIIADSLQLLGRRPDNPAAGSAGNATGNATGNTAGNAAGNMAGNAVAGQYAPVPAAARDAARPLASSSAPAGTSVSAGTPSAGFPDSEPDDDLPF